MDIKITSSNMTTFNGLGAQDFYINEDYSKVAGCIEKHSSSALTEDYNRTWKATHYIATSQIASGSYLCHKKEFCVSSYPSARAAYNAARKWLISTIEAATETTETVETTEQPEPTEYDKAQGYPQDASDLEWDVTFLNWRKIRRISTRRREAVVDFECPGCGHMHKSISFLGWESIVCLGCNATLRREQNPNGPQVFRTLNDFWSYVLLWLVTHKPCLNISGRIQARQFCHKLGACAEDFLWMYDLNEANIDKYLSRLIP